MSFGLTLRKSSTSDGTSFLEVLIEDEVAQYSVHDLEARGGILEAAGRRDAGELADELLLTGDAPDVRGRVGEDPLLRDGAERTRASSKRA